MGLDMSRFATARNCILRLATDVQVHTPLTLLSREQITVWSLGQSSANLSSLSFSGFCGKILYPVGYRHALRHAVVPSPCSYTEFGPPCEKSARSGRELLRVTQATCCRASAILHGRQSELQTRLSPSCRLEYVVRDCTLHVPSSHSIRATSCRKNCVEPRRVRDLSGRSCTDTGDTLLVTPVEITGTRMQVIWDNVRTFSGATPSAPLNKLALHIGDIAPHDGMQVRACILQLPTTHRKVLAQPLDCSHNARESPCK